MIRAKTGDMRVQRLFLVEGVSIPEIVTRLRDFAWSPAGSPPSDDEASLRCRDIARASATLTCTRVEGSLHALVLDSATRDAVALGNQLGRKLPLVDPARAQLLAQPDEPLGRAMRERPALSELVASMLVAAEP